VERWIKNGIRGKGILPLMAGNWSGPVVVMGSGRCLYDDMKGIPKDADIMAVNLAGVAYPHTKHHWVSLHYDYLPHYLGLNKGNYQLGHVFTHSTQDAEVVWDFDDPEICRGTSVLFATLVAVTLGYNPVILVGTPLDGSGNFYHPPGFVVNSWNDGSSHDKWLEYRPLFVNRVFSMSGFTREILGVPGGLSCP
jgi:hypothetical protein